MQKTFTEMQVSQQIYELFQPQLYKLLTLTQHVSFSVPLNVEAVTGCLGGRMLSTR
jgi:hypothetical protein